MAVLATAISTAGTLLLNDPTIRSPLFFPSILSTWFVGTGPGLLAVVLSALSYSFFFTEPRFAFYIGLQDIPDYVVFLLSAFFVSF